MRLIVAIILLASLTACGQARLPHLDASRPIAPTYVVAVEAAAAECGLADVIYVNAQGFREFAEDFVEESSDEELVQADRCLHEQLLDWEQ